MLYIMKINIFILAFVTACSINILPLDNTDAAIPVILGSFLYRLGLVLGGNIRLVTATYEVFFVLILTTPPSVDVE